MAGGILGAAMSGGLALSLYLLLGQQTFYKIDGHLYLAYVLNGERSYPRHFLYLPLVFLARDCLMPLGLSLYESARALSAIGTATGIAFLHLATRRLGLAPWPTGAVVAVCATMPHVVFFATVVEVHGPFMAFFGVAAWCVARLAAAATPGRAAAFGGACALAFCAHSTGTLLPAVLLPLLLFYPRRPWRAGLAPALVTAAVLAAGLAASPWLARMVGVDFDLRHSREFATDRARTNFGAAWRYGSTLLHEWLLPMLPLSVVAPGLVAVRTLRAQVGWLLVGAVLYLAFTQMILGGDPEWGAYLLPFCWPLALLAVRALPRRALTVVVAVQLAVAVAGVRLHDRDHAPRAYADDVRAAAAGAPIALLVADDSDLKAYLLHLQDAERVPLFELARLPVAALEEAVSALRAAVDRLLARGTVVFLSDRSRAGVLAVPVVTPCGRGLIDALERGYSATRTEGAGFTGVILR